MSINADHALGPCKPASGRRIPGRFPASDHPDENTHIPCRIA
ncbi:MAG TPA: hypothetical protein VMU34_00390 [Mycobacterium sp.]|nr:hypothetical protein [Mycobacterium sp.]